MRQLQEENVSQKSLSNSCETQPHKKQASSICETQFTKDRKTGAISGFTSS